MDVLVDGVSQGRAVHPGWADPVGAWSMNLNLAAGTHTLTVNAEHPSHQYTATASSTFTVAQNQGVNVISAYDADGNVTGRTWDSGLAQTLTWDAFGRLIKVAQRDSSNNGYDWSAVYDGLGRRLKTTQQTVTANVASGAATVTTSIYDPQVEFLEIGVTVNGAKAWKVYGPDLNGRYGSLQGTGGLEATIVDAGGETKGVINDQFGNGVASVTGSTVSWFTTRVGAYGPLPGSQVETLTDITRLAEATAWRSRRIDPTGFYCLGARYYEPTSGRFLSADPAGHRARPSLYDYASGDPLNRMDPDGRDSAFSPGIGIFSNLSPKQEIQASRQAAPIVVAATVIIVVAPEVGALATTSAGIKLLGIAAGTGAGSGVLATGLTDLYKQKLSSWQTYASNATGGAAGGVVTLTNGPFMGGAISGELSTVLDDLMNGRKYDPDRVIFNTVVGGVAGQATDLFPMNLEGVNTGNNSFEAIAQQIETKTFNGTISDFTFTTAAKILTYESIINATKNSVSGSLQGYLDSKLFGEDIFIPQDPVGKIPKRR